MELSRCCTSTQPLLALYICMVMGVAEVGNAVQPVHP